MEKAPDEDFNRYLQPRAVKHDKDIGPEQAVMIKSSFTCHICLDIIKDAKTVMECLHRFCNECITESIRKGYKQCPVCRTPVATHRSLRDDPGFDKLIRVFYPNVENFRQQEAIANAKLSKSLSAGNSQFRKALDAAQSRMDNNSERPRLPKPKKKLSAPKKRSTSSAALGTNDAKRARTDAPSKSLSTSATGAVASGAHAPVFNMPRVAFCVTPLDDVDGNGNYARMVPEAVTSWGKLHLQSRPTFTIGSLRRYIMDKLDQSFAEDKIDIIMKGKPSAASKSSGVRVMRLDDSQTLGSLYSEHAQPRGTLALNFAIVAK